MKNKLLTILIILLSSTCYTPSKSEINVAFYKIESLEIIKGFTVKDKDYTLHFDIEKSKNQEHILVIAIELNNGAHFISPHAKRDFSGKFYMDLGSYTHLGFEGDIIESPRSSEEFDPHPFTGGLVNWVRINTTYKQALLLKSQDDFEVFGRLRFTIEPRCTLEEIPFGISYQNGVLKVIEPKC